jgi:type II secretory pathway component PulF
MSDQLQSSDSSFAERPINPVVRVSIWSILILIFCDFFLAFFIYRLIQYAFVAPQFAQMAIGRKSTLPLLTKAMIFHPEVYWGLPILLTLLTAVFHIQFVLKKQTNWFFIIALAGVSAFSFFGMKALIYYSAPARTRACLTLRSSGPDCVGPLNFFR